MLFLFLFIIELKWLVVGMLYYNVNWIDTYIRLILFICMMNYVVSIEISCNVYHSERNNSWHPLKSNDWVVSSVFLLLVVLLLISDSNNNMSSILLLFYLHLNVTVKCLKHFWYCMNKIYLFWFIILWMSNLLKETDRMIKIT